MPMLDRRITVRVESTTTNAFGETETTTADYPVWATLAQDRIARNIIEGGIYANADRVWQVRYNQAFVDAHAAGGSLSIVTGDDSDPEVRNVTGIGEPARADRRRFLDLLS